MNVDITLITFKRFKMKVGADVEDDIRRAKIFRETIGYDRLWVSHKKY